MIRAAILSLLLTAAAAAQTKPTIGQVRGPVAAQGQLLAIVNGRLVPVALGAGVSLVLNGGVYELRATAVPATEARLTRAANGSWTLPASCTLRAVYRNGLRQFSAIDYTVSGTELRFKEGTDATDPSEASDVVIAECQ